MDDLNFLLKQMKASCYRYPLKSINEFIQESKLDLTDILEKHLWIEFKFRNVNQINENNGIYNGQVALVKFLAKKISQSNRTRFTITDFEDVKENVFFKEIELYKSDDVSYSPDDSEYLDDEQIFDKLVISYNKTDYKELLPDLMHEITHAWDNYQSHVKNAPLVLGDVINDERFIKIDKIRKYRQQLRKQGKDVSNLIRNCIHITYALSKAEQNAFRSEIQGELLKHEGELLSLDKAIEIFKGTRTFKDFEFLSNFIDELNKSSDNLAKESFAQLYNSIENKKLSWNKIYKKLRYQFDDYFEVVSKRISKIYREWCESQKKLAENSINKI